MANQSQSQAFRSWEKYLNPRSLRANLASASAFLSAYELLHSSVVDKPRMFFLSGFHNQTETIDLKYKQEVIDLYPKDTFHASCLWFLKLCAITRDDVALVQAIRRHRNDIAHELPKYLMDPDHHVDMQLFESVYSLLAKIDRWWTREVEIPTNPDYDGAPPANISDSQIVSTHMIAMSIIQEIVHGHDEELAGIHRLLVAEWEKIATDQTAPPNQ